MGIAARKMKISMPAVLGIDAEVDLCLSNDAYFLRARLNVSLPGLEPRVARELIESGHRTCPYSKVTRGNIDVLINLVNADSAPLVIVDRPHLRAVFKLLGGPRGLSRAIVHGAYKPLLKSRSPS